jgi:hypothetical protein
VADACGEALAAGAPACIAVSKKTTTSNLGGAPRPQPPFSVEAEVLSSLLDLDSATRVTPWTLRSRDIIRATPACVRVQPLSSMAGAAIEPRRALEPPADPAVAPGLTVPLIVSSVTLDGRARERSRSACSQSKRLEASSSTVSRRLRARSWNCP